MVVLAAATLAAACASLARQAFRTPTVELQDVKIRALGLEGGALDLVLDVYNPNEYRIDVTRLTYTLLADSSQVATGAVTKRVTLDNRAHNGVTLPVTFTFKELLNVAQVMLKTGAVNYTVKGDVVVDSPFGSVTRPYEGKARVENGALLRP
ncbi:MAG: LEA type 2 family protein [Gemmatimonadaceae bacterium]|nr:LEA type 2 family protein [Gemmatimonadaceae bacterium]